MRRIWYLFPVILALSLGLLFSFWVWEEPKAVAYDARILYLDTTRVQQQIQDLDQELNRFRGDMEIVHDFIAEQAEYYEKQRQQLQELVKNTQDYTASSNDIYEEKIVALLGDPVGFSSGAYSKIMVFDFYKIDYRGYVAKVSVKKNRAIEVAMKSDGMREKTSDAMERLGGVLAINGGGFYSAKSGDTTLYLPLGNTVIQSELAHDFVESYKDLTFVGFQEDGDLVGGVFHTEEELLATQAYAGITFVPQLLENGEKLPIPSQWASAKQPRTIVGEYPNKDLLFIVIDGRQSDWSSGVTLEEAQDVLIQLGIKKAYNLDGGGSTTMVFNGKVINKPSDGVVRPVVTNIVIR